MIQTNAHFTDYSIAGLDPRLQGVVLLAGALFVGWLLLYRWSPLRRRSGTARRPFKPYLVSAGLRQVASAPADLRDPKAQMEAIATVGFHTVPLLNREEARLLPVLEQAARALNDGHRVMAQTSLGEIIRPSDTSATSAELSAAFVSINSKRLDFAIFDRFGHLKVAVEYQGTGHYQSRAFMRDAVKREALRKAGVPLLEVAPDFQPDEVAARVTAFLKPS